MANLDSPFGLRPVRMVNGSPFSNQQNRYRIAANYDTSIYQGDLVQVVTGGGIERIAAGGSGLVLGVFNGCTYTDPSSGKQKWSNYYPASTNASDIIAFVIDAPDTVFEVQGDAAFPVADLFGNFDIVDNSPVGDTNSGISNVELAVSTGATTATLPLKALDISQDPLNNDVATANTNVLVVINNHLFSAGTLGLA
jgi:hypothetical protein